MTDVFKNICFFFFFLGNVKQNLNVKLKKRKHTQANTWSQ